MHRFSCVMQLGRIGLGGMGSSMAGRAMAAGHEVVAFDLQAKRVRASVAKGAREAAIGERFTSRGEVDLAHRLLSATRLQFGDHWGR